MNEISRIKRDSKMITVIIKIALALWVVWVAIVLGSSVISYSQAVKAYRQDAGRSGTISGTVTLIPETAGSVSSAPDGDSPSRHSFRIPDGAAAYSSNNGPPGLASYTVSMVFSALNAALIAAVLCVVHSIFSKIQKSGVPFIEGISSKMKITALLIALCATLPYLRHALSAAIPGGIASASFSFNSIFLYVIAGVCYCFAVVFDYGRRLQQQDDETF